jgi:hypothetical protein
MAGYICLHRKLLESTVFENEKMLKVWIWCLLKATWQERDQQVGLQVVHLFPGQFVFGRKVAAAELGMNESTVYQYINVLKTKGNLSIKPNNKFSVINVENWGLYQDNDSVVEQQNNNKITTKKQQNNTNNKVKKVNKDNKKDIYTYSENPSLENALKEFVEFRKKLKKPMTDRAITMLINKLNKMTDNIDTQIKIIEQSIYKGWTDIYSLKEDGQVQQSIKTPVKQNRFVNYEQRNDWDFEELERLERQKIDEDLKKAEGNQ